MRALRQHKNNEFYLIGCPHNSSNPSGNKQAERKLCTALRTGATRFPTGNRITPPTSRVKHILVVFSTQTATSNMSSELLTIHLPATRSDLIKLFKLQNSVRCHSPSQVPDACNQTIGHARPSRSRIHLPLRDLRVLPKFLLKSQMSRLKTILTVI